MNKLMIAILVLSIINIQFINAAKNFNRFRFYFTSSEKLENFQNIAIMPEEFSKPIKSAIQRIDGKISFYIQWEVDHLMINDIKKAISSVLNVRQIQQENALPCGFEFFNVGEPQNFLFTQ